jgi:hypothetical protein
MEFLGHIPRLVVAGGLLALLVVAGVLSLSRREAPSAAVPASAGSPQAAPARPPIDLAAPSSTETATFALG